MIVFNLRGQGNSCQVKVEPPVSVLEGDLFIDKKYTQQVKIAKLTQGLVNYKLRLEQVNRASMSVQVKA
jgi:hypothetical protein